MTTTRHFGPLLLLAALAAATPAQAQTTREQVRAELAQAQRTGDMQAGGESGLKLNELNPGLYPARPAAAGKTREQVRAELAEAVRTGEQVDAETGLMLYELNPAHYPARARLATKTRAQVQAELAEAQRTGDILAGGESGLKLNELFPQRYARTRVLAPAASASMAQRGTAERVLR